MREHPLLSVLPDAQDLTIQPATVSPGCRRARCVCECLAEFPPKSRLLQALFEPGHVLDSELYFVFDATHRREYT